MKKIIIVDVPEGFVLPHKIAVAPAKDNSRDAMIAIKWKEVTLPTEEKIMEIVRHHLIIDMDDKPFASSLIATKIINKILNQ